MQFAVLSFLELIGIPWFRSNLLFFSFGFLLINSTVRLHAIESDAKIGIGNENVVGR
mgnify:CR=1 FL=1